MVVSSNGALGTLQEWGGLATSRLQGVLSTNGAGLSELLGTSKLVGSGPVKALTDIGGVVADKLIDRVVTGKELEALKEIGSLLLVRLTSTVQEAAGQFGSVAGSAYTARFQELGGMARSVAQNTGLTDGLSRLAETVMGVIASGKS